MKIIVLIIICILIVIGIGYILYINFKKYKNNINNLFEEIHALHKEKIELEVYIDAEKNHQQELINEEINEWSRSAQEAARINVKNYIADLNLEITDLLIQKEDLRKEIADFFQKRNTINEDILRQRQIEENQQFYTIQIPEEYKKDIEIINTVRSKISKIDILDKLIYDNYIKKFTDDMIKRVLNGNKPSGIYKITRLKTGEIYIGKSVDIKTRWAQHVKSAFNCGTISHSMLHTVMQTDGVWNFTFEILEEVPKNQLTEREKYYINFYDSKKYGLNEREG